MLLDVLGYRATGSTAGQISCTFLKNTTDISKSSWQSWRSGSGGGCSKNNYTGTPLPWGGWEKTTTTPSPQTPTVFSCTNRQQPSLEIFKTHLDKVLYGLL